MNHAWRCAVVALFALGACTLRDDTPRNGLPYYRSADRTPEWLRAEQANAPSMHRVAPFALRDQHDALVRDSALVSGVTIVHFFYTECGRVCPRSVDSMQRLLRAMRDQPRLTLLSFSVQPERDSVAALAMYAEHRGISDARWHLLTGARTDIEQLATASFLVNLHDGRSYGTDDLAHTETVVLVDQQRRIRGLYNVTLALDMQQLESDARTLLKQAGD
jgi:protein SCO1/2